MTAPWWQEDDPKNLSLIQGNVTQLITELRATATNRVLPTRDELCRWPDVTCRSPAMSGIFAATRTSQS